MATGIAHQMVECFGMSERLGKVALGYETLHPLSEQTAALVDDEIERTIHEAYERARTIVTTHRDALDRRARELLQYSTIESVELEHLFLPEATDLTAV